MSKNSDLDYDLDVALERRSQIISRQKIDALRMLIASSKLVPPSISDKQLALFIDASQGHIDTARKTCITYYSVKRNAPEHFSDRDPYCKAIQQCFNNQHYFILPSKNECPIIFHQLSNSKPSNYYFDNAIKTFFMSIDVCLHMHGPQNGIIFLFDMRNVRIGHLTRVKIASIRKFFQYVQEGMPARLCEIHILNVVSFFDKILSLIRPFIRSDIFKVLHTYSSDKMDDFYENVLSRDNLPKDFGGNLKDADEMHKDFINEFYKRREYFQTEEKLRSFDRTETDQPADNFHKLNID